MVEEVSTKQKQRARQWKKCAQKKHTHTKKQRVELGNGRNVPKKRKHKEAKSGARQ